MATKVERTVLLPESVYNRIVRIAKEEHSNIPWVTRQLLAKAMADLKGKPEWFYEIEEQIEGLRNETLVVERAKRKGRTALHLEGAEEQLLVELKKQIEGLRREITEVREETRARLKEQKPKEHVGNRFATRHLLVNALAEERKEPDRPEKPDRFKEIQRDLEWLRSEVQAAQKQREKQEQTGEQLYSELKKQIADLKDALAVTPETLELNEEEEECQRVFRQLILGKPLEVDEAEVESYTDIINEIWGLPLEIEGEAESEQEAMPTTAAYLLWGESPDLEEESEQEAMTMAAAYLLCGKSPDLEEEPMAESMKEAEPELVEEVASIKPAAKGKVLRPFFGRLTAMFSSVLG